MTGKDPADNPALQPECAGDQAPTLADLTVLSAEWASVSAAVANGLDKLRSQPDPNEARRLAAALDIVMVAALTLRAPLLSFADELARELAAEAAKPRERASIN